MISILAIALSLRGARRPRLWLAEVPVKRDHGMPVVPVAMQPTLLLPPTS
jgi:hypothetical protein